MESIALGETLSRAWDDVTFSKHWEGSFAKYFTFSLRREATVKISLQSEKDTYLILLNLDRPDHILARNDDTNDSFNSELICTLEPGDYMIEATTYLIEETGSFTLSVEQVAF